MKTCSLNDFMAEIKPWLDKDHIREAHLDDKGHFVLHFLDGIKNVYSIDDCNEAQIKGVLKDLKKQGVAATELLTSSTAFLSLLDNFLCQVLKHQVMKDEG